MRAPRDIRAVCCGTRWRWSRASRRRRSRRNRRSRSTGRRCWGCAVPPRSSRRRGCSRDRREGWGSVAGLAPLGLGGGCPFCASRRLLPPPDVSAAAPRLHHQQRAAPPHGRVLPRQRALQRAADLHLVSAGRGCVRWGGGGCVLASPSSLPSVYLTWGAVLAQKQLSREAGAAAALVRWSGSEREKQCFFSECVGRRAARVAFAVSREKSFRLHCECIDSVHGILKSTFEGELCCFINTVFPSRLLLEL